MSKKLLMPCLMIFWMGLAAQAEPISPDTTATAEPAIAAPAEPVAADVAPVPEGAPVGTTEAAQAPEMPVQSADDLLAFLPDVVATYGEKTLTATEVKDLIRPQLQRALQAGGPAIPETEIKSGVTELIKQMVDMNLLSDLAAAKGFKPDSEAAKKELDKAVQENPMLEAMIAAQGGTLEKAIEQSARMMAIDKWVETQIVPAHLPSDEQLRKYYDEHAAEFEKPETRKLSHILVQTKESDPVEEKAAAKKKCEDLLAQVKAGGDFAALAKENSDCPSGKQSGGSLGECANDGSLVKEFTDAAFQLEDGKVSEVVATEFGYHVIRVDGIQPAGKIPLDQVKDEIAKELSGPKVNEAVMKALEEARTAAKVQIHL
jgi:parvulin-like peptidyl-prolyl isomerase